MSQYSSAAGPFFWFHGRIPVFHYQGAAESDVEWQKAPALPEKPCISGYIKNRNPFK
jgi:hypothetical protein